MTHSMYWSCLCCHLYERIGLFMTTICGGFPLIYISLARKNRVGTFLTGLTLPYFVGCKMYKSTFPCRICYSFVCETVRMTSNIRRFLYLFIMPYITHKMLSVYIVLFFLTGIYSTLQ